MLAQAPCAGPSLSGDALVTASLSQIGAPFARQGPACPRPSRAPSPGRGRGRQSAEADPASALLLARSLSLLVAHCGILAFFFMELQAVVAALLSATAALLLAAGGPSRLPRPHRRRPRHCRGRGPARRGAQRTVEADFPPDQPSLSVEVLKAEKLIFAAKQLEGAAHREFVELLANGEVYGEDVVQDLVDALATDVEHCEVFVQATVQAAQAKGIVKAGIVAAEQPAGVSAQEFVDLLASGAKHGDEAHGEDVVQDLVVVLAIHEKHGEDVVQATVQAAQAQGFVEGIVEAGIFAAKHLEAASEQELVDLLASGARHGEDVVHELTEAPQGARRQGKAIRQCCARHRWLRRWRACSQSRLSRRALRPRSCSAPLRASSSMMWRPKSRRSMW